MSDTSAIPMDAEPGLERVETPPWDETPASPTADTAQPGPEAVDERLEALNRIARRNHEQDNNITTSRVPTPDAEQNLAAGAIPGSQDQGDPNAATNAATNQEEAMAAPDRSEERVAVTIDGRTEMVPLKTVIKGYQIESAARKRLGEAAALYKRLRQRESTLGTAGTPPPHTGTPGFPSPPAGDSGAEQPTPDEIQGYLERNEPVATQAPAAPVNPEQLAEYVFMRQEVRSEKQRLGDTQPHIARDPRLSGMHAHMVMEAMEEQPGLPTREYFDHATEAINQWLLQLTTAKLTRTTESGQRLMDKREATNKQAPVGIHRKVPSGTDAPAPPTYADKIRQMKQARGLT
ncbi:MAG: hypothetical protein HQL84_09980 [Magnetococcales bacterium]|nr:hypothetical protein [Magnetococcales bacterium]MBF0150359.1 hypothetical protein [Magnetococcales bacterium]